MKKNIVTSDKGYGQQDIDNIKNQLPFQLQEIGDNSVDEDGNPTISEEHKEGIKQHFLFVLSNDFYKNELTSEQITSMESFLDSNYEELFED
jgi:uncharacterized protein (DUF2267 family)|tara:strand:+ start:1704 stop:1979 length:276 start_codon:yes stop_codon:yes gene_type:complete